VKTIWPQFDYNLLRIPLALAETGNVSDAAELLGLSQSGLSTALARLRRTLHDPVFVRTHQGMVPTPRCERLLKSARAAMDLIHEGVLEQPAFDPATSTEVFSLAMTDVAEIVFLPRLLQHLNAVAPGTTVKVANHPPQTVQQALIDGEVDLVLGYFPELKGTGFFKQRFYTHTYACIARRNHPIIKGKLNLKDYLSQGHAMVTAPARSLVSLERHLQQQGIHRRVVLSTPHYLSLPAIIESTDLIATVPLAACARFARQGTLQLLRTPFDPPSFSVQQHWHRRTHHELKNKWLREQLVRLFDESQDEWKQIESALYGPRYRGLKRSD
jgi:DNA-binding transcriptional LysR family regulator